MLKGLASLLNPNGRGRPRKQRRGDSESLPGSTETTLNDLSPHSFQDTDFNKGQSKAFGSLLHLSIDDLQPAIKTFLESSDEKFSQFIQQVRGVSPFMEKVPKNSSPLFLIAQSVNLGRLKDTTVMQRLLWVFLRYIMGQWGRTVFGFVTKYGRRRDRSNAYIREVVDTLESEQLQAVGISETDRDKVVNDTLDDMWISGILIHLRDFWGSGSLFLLFDSLTKNWNVEDSLPCCSKLHYRRSILLRYSLMYEFNKSGAEYDRFTSEMEKRCIKSTTRYDRRNRKNAT